jgi:hypothetical protein
LSPEAALNVGKITALDAEAEDGGRINQLRLIQTDRSRKEGWVAQRRTFNDVSIG